jgi:hypothetical protein
VLIQTSKLHRSSPTIYQLQTTTLQVLLPMEPSQVTDNVSIQFPPPELQQKGDASAVDCRPAIHGQKQLILKTAFTHSSGHFHSSTVSGKFRIKKT